LRREDGSLLYQHRYNKNVDIRYFSNKEINPAWQEILLSARFRLHLDPALLDYDAFVDFDSLFSGCTLARKLKRNGKSVVLDIDDDIPEMIKTSLSIPSFLGSIGYSIGRRRLRKVASDADRITCTIDSLRESYGISPAKCVEIPNGVDTGLFRQIDNSLRDELGLDDVFVIGYSGVLREWVDFEPVYMALKRLEGIKLLVIGQEGLLRENVELARKHNVDDKVVFVGTVPFTDVPRYISACDVCIIPFRQNAVTNNAVPLKLFEYMACEKPVISTPFYGVKSVVGDLVKYYSNPEELQVQISHLKENEKARSELGKEGRTFVESNFSWDTLCRRFEDVLLGAVSRRSALP
jgi:glycosyltransferase involved in cell wall biosynthesis